MKNAIIFIVGLAVGALSISFFRRTPVFEKSVPQDFTQRLPAPSRTASSEILNGEAGATILNSLDEGLRQEVADRIRYFKLSENGLVAEMQKIEKLPNGPGKLRQLTLIIEYLARKNPLLAISTVEQATGPDKLARARGAFAGWSFSDGLAPLGWLNDHTAGFTTGQAVELLTVASNCIADRGLNADQIQGALNNLVPLGQREMVLNRIILRLAVASPERATELVQSLGSRADRTEGVASLSKALATTNPQTALQWIASLPPADQVAGYASAIPEWLLSDTGAEAEFLSWLKSQPDSFTDKNLNAILSAATPILMRRNPEKGLALVNEINNPKERDKELGAAAEMLARTDLENAQVYASNISNPAQKERTLASIYSKIQRVDPKKARSALLDDASITPEQRAKIAHIADIKL